MSSDADRPAEPEEVQATEQPVPGGAEQARLDDDERDEAEAFEPVAAEPGTGGALFDTVPEGSIRRARLAAEAASRATVSVVDDASAGAPLAGVTEQGAAADAGLPAPDAASEAAPGADPAAAPPSATSEPGSVAAKPPRPSYVFLAVTTGVSLGLDLASKGWAKAHFENNEGGPTSVVLIDELFSKLSLSFIYAKNRGGAWGLLQDQSEAVRRPFFLVVSVAAIVFIVSLYRKLTPAQRALRWGLPLVLGGALGNLIDRIRYGFVVDFIDFFVAREGRPAWHWPTFNVADIAIVMGVALMAIDMFTSRPKKKKKAEAPVTSDPSVDGATPPTAPPAA
ncbi:MAG: signal peptidase II [Polyangiaceae bacterium]|nr:signal peptidase II [Polyangiaceae bacterium]